MSSVNPTGRLLRRLGVGVLTLVVTAPIAFVLFAMGLMVAEVVMFPLATLVIAVITAIIASWAAWRLAGDGMRTDVTSVTARNLAWGLVPAAVALAFPLLLVPLVFVTGSVLVYTVVVATALAFRHRTAERSIGKKLAQTACWLVGTGITTAAVIFVASLLNLTGA